DFNGSDSFTYKVCDDGTTNGSPDSKCDKIGRASCRERVNDPPVAHADLATVAEDGSTNVNVLANDSPGPANESTQTLTTDSVTAGPIHGTATVMTSGTDKNKVACSSDLDFNGSDSFTYKVCDDGTTNGSPDSKCD